jgi:SAM-dependent methyltransferase
MLHRLRSFARRAVRRLVRPALDELEPVAIHGNPYVAGKLYPMAGSSTEHVQLYPEGDAARGDEEIPIPPEELWLGYAETPEEFLECGRQDIATMLAILSEAGAAPDTLSRVLDFGCPAGRMLRFFPREGAPELWGVDIDARLINWCQLNMGPPFSFLTTTTTPHLPFEEGYFDLIYVGSVFTHISDLADAWFLELRRIVRKGGYLYITIHDRRTVELLLTKYKHHPLFLDFVPMVESFCERTGVRSQKYAYFTMLADPMSQVFYDEEYLVRKWSQWAEILSVNPEAHDHQTALLLQKRY